MIKSLGLVILKGAIMKNIKLLLAFLISFNIFANTYEVIESNFPNQMPIGETFTFDKKYTVVSSIMGEFISCSDASDETYKLIGRKYITPDFDKIITCDGTSFIFFTDLNQIQIPGFALLDLISE